MAERDPLVPLEGTLNFRDLGGCSVPGGTVATGRIYRSDRLDELTDQDQAELLRRGISLVCDFRYDREIELQPSRLPAGVASVGLPVGADLADTDATIEQRIERGEITSVTPGDIADGYLRMLSERAALFGEMVTLAADEANHAMVVHCTAGKDRTGLAAMLLLGALGADAETIVADYHLTDRYRSARRLAEITPELEAMGLEIDPLRPLFTAPEATMVATLDGVSERWGSVVGYLEGPAAVDAATLESLRTSLIV